MNSLWHTNIYSFNWYYSMLVLNGCVIVNKLLLSVQYCTLYTDFSAYTSLTRTQQIEHLMTREAAVYHTQTHHKTNICIFSHIKQHSRWFLMEMTINYKSNSFPFYFCAFTIPTWSPNPCCFRWFCPHFQFYRLHLNQYNPVISYNSLFW